MDYTAECLKTWNCNHRALTAAEGELLNLALGVAGEGGELANLVKKQTFYGKPRDRDALIDELGDVLYYCAMLADHLGVTLEEVQERNIAKLRQRHGETFNAEHYSNGRVPGVHADGHVYVDRS